MATWSATTADDFNGAIFQLQGQGLPTPVGQTDFLIYQGLAADREFRTVALACQSTIINNKAYMYLLDYSDPDSSWTRLGPILYVPKKLIG
jgi:hypothetical protein